MNARTHERRSTIRLAATLLAAVAALATGCGPRHEPASANADSTPPVEVAAIRAGSGSGEPGLILPARVAAREEVTVRATLGARLSALPYDEGESFPAGAVLARFDAVEMRSAVAAARAGLSAAALRLELARKQEARMESLYADRVAALRELELARQEREAAEAAHAAAAAAQAGIASGAEVRAPFAGVVVRHHVDAGTSLGSGDAVLDVRSRASGEIVAAVPEAWSGGLAGTRASVRIGTGPWHPAALLRVDGMTDYTTRTRTARFRLASAGSAALDPGAFAEVRLEALAARPLEGKESPAPAGAITVPSGSVIRRGSLTGVYVIQDGHAWLRWVRLGRADASSSEVLAGLNAGEMIAVDPSKLADGRAVAVRR